MWMSLNKNNEKLWIWWIEYLMRSYSLHQLPWCASFFYILNRIFLSSHMYPENLEGTQVIVSSMNMGYNIYPTLPGIELTTRSVPSSAQFVRGWGFNPHLVPLNPLKFSLTPHWFSKKYIKNTLLTPFWFYHKFYHEYLSQVCADSAWPQWWTHVKISIHMLIMLYLISIISWEMSYFMYHASDFVLGNIISCIRIRGYEELYFISKCIQSNNVVCEKLLISSCHMSNMAPIVTNHSILKPSLYIFFICKFVLLKSIFVCLRSIPYFRGHSVCDDSTSSQNRLYRDNKPRFQHLRCGQHARIIRW